MLVSTADRAIIIKSSLIPRKNTRTSGGITLMSMRKGDKLVRALTNYDEKYNKLNGYRKYKLPATGQLLADEDLSALQMKI
jgi:hypothetical protein